ncbi:late competence protein ComER [Bacillus songklensis]|uniref:Pyrroline-5-carboxylate reductase n=1 Tax=Bacillus songklensis TaxID=1069116 RepID=A0ABV8AYD0_9BACI
MNIGLIGTGNMGRILIEAFIESKAVQPANMIVTNRTIEKAYDIQAQHPSVKVAQNAKEVVQHSNIIFLCVKPLDIHPLLIQLKNDLQFAQCIVSITSPISVEQLESVVNCQVARIIPSITNRALAGVSLFTYGESCSRDYQQVLYELFSAISHPVLIDHSITRIASDIVSCGPAFLSFLLQKFVSAAVSETNISKEKAIELASQMVIGMGKLLEKEIFTLPTLQEKVCVKGGVTGEGIKVLEAELGNLFEHVFQQTHAKYYEDIEKVGQQFNI